MIKGLNLKIFIICTLAFVLSIAFSIRTEIEVFKEQNILGYYPHKEMEKIFRDEWGNNGFTQIVEKIEEGKIQIKQMDEDARVVMVYEVTENYIKLVFTEQSGKYGFKQNYIKDLKPNRDDFIIKAPIEIGTKWYDKSGGYYEIIKTDAIVETSIDKYETLVVRYKNDDFTVKEYYAKGIGLVKIVVNNFSGYQLEKISYEWVES
ncbi:MAG: hypothetical protein PHY91_04875 [Tissierellia bacterium]|nr:hypothetical protein [Tissierellia bacterium]MDD4726238.1 hypothetical protein [Tissierellia bacterium]